MDPTTYLPIPSSQNFLRSSTNGLSEPSPSPSPGSSHVSATRVLLQSCQLLVMRLGWATVMEKTFFLKKVQEESSMSTSTAFLTKVSPLINLKSYLSG